MGMLVNYKMILVLLVVAGASSLYYFYFQGSSAPSKEYSVVLTAEGFSPPSLSIRKGDTVTFTTVLGKPFWPASDLHPTHGIYPEFDPREPVESDKFWSFTFKKTGTWKYHDHLFSSYRGVITVEDRKSISTSYSLSDCEGAENRLKCWEEMVDSTLDKKGLNATFELVADFYNAYPDFTPNCHDYTHKIGIAAYEKFAKGQEVELTPKTYYCGYGFYHGFMETLLHQGGKIEEAQKFCKYAGHKLASQTSDAEGACYHGIGHGTVDGGDPTSWGNPQKMIEPGIKMCEYVSKEQPHLYRCVTGVYNAIEILSTDPKYNLSMMVKNPFWLCPSQPDAYKEGCYTNMLPALFRFAGNDFSKMAKVIEKLPSDGDKESLALLGHTVKEMVMLSLFYDYIMLNLREPDYNIGHGIGLCRSLAPDLRLSCIEGLAGGHMKFGEPEREHIKGLAFCGSRILQEDEKSSCHKYILTRLRIWYSPDKTKAICQEIPAQYREFCPR